MIGEVCVCISNNNLHYFRHYCSRVLAVDKMLSLLCLSGLLVAICQAEAASLCGSSSVMCKSLLYDAIVIGVVMDLKGCPPMNTTRQSAAGESHRSPTCLNEVASAVEPCMGHGEEYPALFCTIQALMKLHPTPLTCPTGLETCKYVFCGALNLSRQKFSPQGSWRDLLGISSLS